MAASMGDGVDDQVVEQTEIMDSNVLKRTPATSKALIDIDDTTALPLLLLKSKKKTESTGPPKTFQLPPSSVLQQVQAFLPQMAAAQTKLQQTLQEDPTADLNIENVDNCDKVIEMTLALVEDESEDSDTESSDDEESPMRVQSADPEKEPSLFGPVTEQNLKLSQHKKKPIIEEIAMNNNEILTESAQKHSSQSQ